MLAPMDPTRRTTRLNNSILTPTPHRKKVNNVGFFWSLQNKSMLYKIAQLIFQSLEDDLDKDNNKNTSKKTI